MTIGYDPVRVQTHTTKNLLLSVNPFFLRNYQSAETSLIDAVTGGGNVTSALGEFQSLSDRAASVDERALGKWGVGRAQHALGNFRDALYSAADALKLEPTDLHLRHEIAQYFVELEAYGFASHQYEWLHLDVLAIRHALTKLAGMHQFERLGYLDLLLEVEFTQGIIYRRRAKEEPSDRDFFLSSAEQILKTCLNRISSHNSGPLYVKLQAELALVHVAQGNFSEAEISMQAVESTDRDLYNQAMRQFDAEKALTRQRMKKGIAIVASNKEEE